VVGQLVERRIVERQRLDRRLLVRGFVVG